MGVSNTYNYPDMKQSLVTVIHSVYGGRFTVINVNPQEKKPTLLLEMNNVKVLRPCGMHKHHREVILQSFNFNTIKKPLFVFFLPGDSTFAAKGIVKKKK